MSKVKQQQFNWLVTEKRMKKTFLPSVPLLLLAAIAQAQTSATFPASSAPATALELNVYLSGKSFRANHVNETRVLQ